VMHKFDATGKRLFLLTAKNQFIYVPVPKLQATAYLLILIICCKRPQSNR
jgi:hypothetical protein